MMKDGQPQSSVVWFDYDGECLRVNTTKERQKGKNIIANPRVSMLIVDPNNTSRYVQVQGQVEIIEDGAIEHLDKLTRQYTRHPKFYGYVYPSDQQYNETRMICRIHASKVTLDAIGR
jgi:PPOX class probable F420-dependent enzyme